MGKDEEQKKTLNLDKLLRDATPVGLKEDAAFKKLINDSRSPTIELAKQLTELTKPNIQAMAIWRDLEQARTMEARIEIPPPPVNLLLLDHGKELRAREKEKMELLRRGTEASEGALAEALRRARQAEAESKTLRNENRYLKRFAVLGVVVTIALGIATFWEQLVALFEFFAG